MSYTVTDRYTSAIAAFEAAAREDPQVVADVAQAKATEADAADSIATQGCPYSLFYHRTLWQYVQKLDPSPSEALALASRCQHIRRWEIARSSYPDGLSGYKKWRFDLNKFHVSTSQQILQGSGYDADNPVDQEHIFRPLSDYLMKRTLKGGDDKGDAEMQVFEDAICLTFLELEFADFSAKHDEDKLVKIVQKTWAKMGVQGREYATSKLAGGLPEESRLIIMRALSST